jgi:hypothetical protein
MRILVSALVAILVAASLIAPTVSAQEPQAAFYLPRTLPNRFESCCGANFTRPEGVERTYGSASGGELKLAVYIDESAAAAHEHYLRADAADAEAGYSMSPITRGADADEEWSYGTRAEPDGNRRSAQHRVGSILLLMTYFEPHGVGGGDIEAIWLEMIDRARSAPQR